MGIYSLKDRLRIAQEEAEQQVVSDVQTDGSGTVQVTDAVQAESDAAEIAEMQTQVQQDQEALEEAQDVADAVEEQIQANDEKLENPAEVTPADVQASQEALKDALTAYGESLKTIRGVNMSYESIEASPARALELSQEGLKDFFVKLWEGLKNMYKKMIDFFKKLWTKIKGFFGNLEAKCQALIDKCNSASDDASTKDIDGDAQKKVVQNMGGVLFIASKNNIEAIPTTVLKFDNFKKVLTELTTQSNEVASKSTSILSSIISLFKGVDNKPASPDSASVYTKLDDVISKFTSNIDAYTKEFSQPLMSNAGVEGANVKVYSFTGNKLKTIEVSTDHNAESVSKLFKAEVKELTTIPDPSGMNNFNKDKLKKILENTKAVVSAVKVYDPQQAIDTVSKNMEKAANDTVKEANKLEENDTNKDAVAAAKNVSKAIRNFYNFAGKGMNDIYTDYYNNIKGFISGMSVLVGALAKEKDGE